MAKTVTVKVADFFGSDIPRRLVDLIDKMQEVLDSIPEDHRAEAEVDCEPTYEFGESYANIAVTYERPQTPEEVAADEAEERRRKLRQLRQAEHDAARLREALGVGS